jgi:UDP-N-acetylmuramoyl-L-alanyl-D-glutamate--2,6-diaminopimelate ligase
MLAVETRGPRSGPGLLQAHPPSRPAVPPGPYLILGLGRAGSACAEALLSERRYPVLAWDSSTSSSVRSTAKRLQRGGAIVSLGGDGVSALDAAGADVCVVKSPGIDWGVEVLRQAQRRGLPIFDELEIGWRRSEASIVGITGTNGKSTTARLVCALLEAGGHSPQLAGNTEFGPALSAAPPTPWVVCEVSSFQLEGSEEFLPEIAVLTNLTLEHLDRHGTMDAYGKAKRRMFLRGRRTPRVSVINFDDPFGRSLSEEVASAGGQVLSYGFSPGAEIQIEGAEWNVRAANIHLRTPQGRVTLATGLPGAHNASNAAAAAAVGQALGLTAAQIADTLAGVDPPAGRWQVLTRDEPFDVVVDYAHTPDGLRQALLAARGTIAAHRGARLLTVFGAVGLSEPRKALESGRVVRELSDHVIFTTGTAPGAARLVRLAELRQAATSGGSVEIVLERGEAIRRAIAQARTGDIVAVLGLGAVARQILDAAGTRVPFDDCEAVRQALAGEAARWR